MALPLPAGELRALRGAPCEGALLDDRPHGPEARRLGILSSARQVRAAQGMDMIQIFTCEQGTDEWRKARAGIPTASRFSDVLAQGQGKTRRKYMMELLGERLTGEPMAEFSNAHT